MNTGREGTQEAKEKIGKFRTEKQKRNKTAITTRK